MAQHHTRSIREALRQLPETAAQESLEPPPAAQLYVPESHTKALGLDATLVVGMRGAGKSVWTAALFDPATRRVLVQAGAPRILGQTEGVLPATVRAQAGAGA
jgi:hypothetical protein